MRLLFLGCCILFFSSTGRANSVLASSFGYNTTDATLAFQNAINSPNDTIIIDFQPGAWNVGPSTFFNLTNKVIIFEDWVELRALPGAFDPIYSILFRMVNCSDVTILGYNAAFIMNKPEYELLDDSEYRHCLGLSDCTNIIVKGLTLRDSGGDGIYMSGDEAFGQGYCKNILVEDVRCINNYRQGMSVISVENLTVRHSLFTETKGTLPEAGVDIEPDYPAHRIVNVLFEYCNFIDNGWSGIALALFQLDDTSLPVSITVRDCYFSENCRPENEYAKSEIYSSARDNNPVQGNALFERCLVSGSDYAAFYSRKTAQAYGIEFSDCFFEDVSRLQAEFNNPIFLEVPSYSEPSAALGGYAFNNVFISYPTNFDFFRVFGWSTLEGLANISGNFTVVEPFGNGVLYENVPDTTNVSFTFEQFDSYTSLPDVAITGSAVIPQAVECDSIPAENVILFLQK